jgi:lipopolysaccharide assembly protein B
VLDMQAGEADTARGVLAGLHVQHPRADLLHALLSLDPDPQHRRALLLQHLQRQPSLSAAQALLREQAEQKPGHADEAAALQQTLGHALRPLRRYRCAACGFEAQHHFWQCPGCHGWDTYPSERLEDQ